MAPVTKVKCESETSQSELKGVQNPLIKGRSKQHDITLDIAKQVQNKVDASEKALIMTEVNTEEIKIITNSGNFKVISEEVMKLNNGNEIKGDVATAKVTDQNSQKDKNGVAFMIKTEFSVTDVATGFQQKSCVALISNKIILHDTRKR